MVDPSPPWTHPNLGSSSAAPREGAGDAQSADHAADGLSFWQNDRSWEAHRDLPSSTVFLCIVVAIAVVTVAALVAGGSGSPQFSIGLAFGVGIGAVPYLLFVVAHAGSTYALGDHTRRHKLTEEEWQRIFGQDHGSSQTAGHSFSGSASSASERSGFDRRDDAAEAREQMQRAYALLGLSPDASQRAVRSAYHRLAHRHHPDKATGQSEEARRLAEERMKALNAAYDLLRRQSRSNDVPSENRESPA